MGYVTSDGEKLRGEAVTAAATDKFHFPLYDQSLRGADITSAAGGVIGGAGAEEYFHVNVATTTITYYDTTFLLDGKEIVLYFVGNQTLVHNGSSPPGGTVLFDLSAGVSASVLNGQTLILRYDATLARMVQIGGTVGSSGGAPGVLSISAGPGISITGTGTVPVVNNTGVLSITAGAGISVTGTGANPVVTNTGVLSITAGTNVSLGGTAQNPIINAATGGGPVTPVLYRRPNIAGMVGIDASAFLTSDAHICEVLSVGDFYRYTPSTTIPQTDGINAVLNTGGGGGQWVRMNIPNLIFQQATYWAIDPSNSTGVASDENDGWGTSQAAADAVPLLTRAELNRRLVGVDAPTTRIFHLLSSETTLSGSDVLTNLKSGHGQGFPIFIGKKTQVGSDYTVTAYAAAVPASNTGFLLSATGLGAGGNVGKLVTNAAETKWAFIKSSLGANQVRIQQPDAWDTISQSGSFSAPFSVGETVRVWNLPVLRNFPFSHQVMSAAIETCEIQGRNSNVGDLGIAEFGNDLFVAHSIINGVTIAKNGGFGGAIIGSLFSKNFSSFSGDGQTTLVGVGVLGLSVVFTGGTILATQAPLDLENSSLQFQHDAYISVDGSGAVSAFNVPNTVSGGHMISCSRCARFIATVGATPFYGSGNSAKILQGSLGTVSQLPPATTTVATSDASPITLAGATYTVSQIPIMDLSTLSGIGLGAGIGG